MAPEYSIYDQTRRFLYNKVAALDCVSRDSRSFCDSRPKMLNNSLHLIPGHPSASCTAIYLRRIKKTPRPKSSYAKKIIQIK